MLLHSLDFYKKLYSGIPHNIMCTIMLHMNNNIRTYTVLHTIKMT